MELITAIAIMTLFAQVAHYFYKRQQRDPLLREKVPWHSIIDMEGLVLNKNGSLQKTFIYRGPDLDSVTGLEIDALTKKINNVLKRVQGDWSMFMEVQRVKSMEYPESNFQEPVAAIIDTERRVYFQQGQHFECRYYITLSYLPPSDRFSLIKEFFIERATQRRQENYENHHIPYFREEAGRIYRMLDPYLTDIRPLSNEETMTYLHSCVSPRRHIVNADERYRIDRQLVDTPLYASLEPMLGEPELDGSHVRVISILQYPNTSEMGMLEVLDTFNFEYRWITRYMPIEKQKALSIIKETTRKWFNNRLSAWDSIKAVFTHEMERIKNMDAYKKSLDSEQAEEELRGDVAAFGLYTISIVLMDQDYDRANDKAVKIRDVINDKGYTARIETYYAVDAWLGSLPGNTWSNIRAPMQSSLNVAHFMPIAAKWTGPEKNAAWGGPPLFFAQSVDRTPFRFDLHDKSDVGHALVIGPTGAGKSFFLQTMQAQSRRYPNSQSFIFDKGGSSRALTVALGGDFYDLGHETTPAFQPLSNLDSQAEIEWALEWLMQIMANENAGVITPERKGALWNALQSVRAYPPENRTMDSLRTHIQDEIFAEALRSYGSLGPYGSIFNANRDDFKYNRIQAFEMETLMETKPSVVEPTLMYLFHRLESYFSETKPRPSILYLDEAWRYLQNEIFMQKMGSWLRELRKKKVDVVFATQALDEIDKSPIKSVIIDSCKTKIYLPNPNALSPNTKPIYQSFGLNDREIQIIADAVEKRQYYVTTDRGNNRLIELGIDKAVCPFGSAYIGASSREDQEMVKNILATHGQEGFNAEFMRRKGLVDHIKVYQNYKPKVS